MSADTGWKFLTRVVVWTILHQSVVATINSERDIAVLHNLYSVCPRGLTLPGQQLVTFTGRSSLDCASRCSQLASCGGLSVCPVSKGLDPADDKVQCSLLQLSGSGTCVGLDVTAAPSSCTFMLKDSADLDCHNGGTSNGTHCACPIQYSGTTCQRFIRDCTEAYLNGYQSTSYIGAYLIQPLTSLSPFSVYCVLRFGGVTYPFRRTVATTTTASINMTWAAARDGLDSDALSNPNSNSFFAGLENLHQLLAQAEYVNRVSMTYGASSDVTGNALYDNFTLGSEAESYELRYDRFSVLGDPSGTGNGFAAASPVVFCTADRDCPINCVAKRGAAGWYGSDCNGYSPFSDTPQWPFFGVDETLKVISFALTRAGEFYDAN